jgi:hypothetical protein
MALGIACIALVVFIVNGVTNGCDKHRCCCPDAQIKTHYKGEGTWVAFQYNQSGHGCDRQFRSFSCSLTHSRTLCKRFDYGLIILKSRDRVTFDYYDITDGGCNVNLQCISSDCYKTGEWVGLYKVIANESPRRGENHRDSELRSRSRA